MIDLSRDEETMMPAKRWPTIEEGLRAVREGILDDSKVSSWPDPETVEAMREDLERFRAERQADQQNGKTAAITDPGASRDRARKSRSGT
jgi:hypothetical protein